MVRDNCIDTIASATLSQAMTMPLSWRGWARDGGRLAAREVLRLVKLVKVWDRRACARRALAALDDRLLQDIGVTRDAADREACKPFWKA